MNRFLTQCVIALAVGLLPAPSCSPRPGPNPPIPPGPIPVQDGAPPPAPPPDPTSPPVPPSPSTDVYTGACEAAARLNCPEGKDPTCSKVLRHAVEKKITPEDATCASKSGSIEGIRKCGAFFQCK